MVSGCEQRRDAGRGLTEAAGVADCVFCDIMTEVEKIRKQVLSGTADKSISFRELLTLAHSLPLEHRTGGKHPHIFVGSTPDMFLNLQPDKGNKAKPYQVKQVRRILKTLERSKP